MNYHNHVTNSLANAVLAGDLSAGTIKKRLIKSLNKTPAWISQLARELADRCRHVHPQELNASLVCKWLNSNQSYHKALLCNQVRIRHYYFLPDLSTGSIAVNALQKKFHLPLLENTNELADWLGLERNRLPWFVDHWYVESSTDKEALRHYHYHQQRKTNGHLRILETPKTELKGLQRFLVKNLLNKIPVHAAAHGFVKGKSAQSFAIEHSGKRVILAMDLQHFFLSVFPGRIKNLFIRLGYGPEVAAALMGLVTNVMPYHQCRAIDNLDTRRLYMQSHLPQGAPTSPAVANLATYVLDVRLSKLAERFGFYFSRYADDLVFSSDLPSRKETRRLLHWAEEVVNSEGFKINPCKTRILSRACRQRLLGFTVNHNVNIPRADFDAFKAQLYNCVHRGPNTQNHRQHENFRAHLLGKLSYFKHINPEKSKKLTHLFEQIIWPA